MAQGKKYNDDIKEQAFAYLACNNNVAYVAKVLKLPYSTVKTWEKQYLAKSKDLKQKQGAEESQNKDNSNDEEEKNLAKLRQKKKEEFVERSWQNIGRVQTILERRLERAITSEDKIDELVNEICELSNTELNSNQRKALYIKISSIKVESIKELTVALGTLYDKQALANKESTVNVGVGDFMKVIEEINKGGEY